MMEKIFEALKWFKGKKRRISVVCLTIAPLLPEQFQNILYVVGVLFGGADAANMVKAKRKAR
jgi:hypothetical protein